MRDPFASLRSDMNPPALAVIADRLPILASTSFCMDLLLQGPVLDLKSLREVLTFDPCAMLRLFQQAAVNAVDAGELPHKLDDCIVALGASGLRDALMFSPSTWRQQSRLQTFAEHATAVARVAGLLAVTAGLCEETAFLVGSFHEIGTLSTLLELPSSRGQAPPCLQEVERLCSAYFLPQRLSTAILAVHQPERPSPWSFLMDAAHELIEAETRLSSL